MTTSLTRRTLLTGGGRESALRSVAVISEHCFAFTGVSCRSCEDACDGNDDGVLDLGDAVYLLRWLFRGGLIPPPPGPFVFGIDPTEDQLDCSMPCE